MKNSWHIVGVGSPHGDDRVGWEVIERLSRLPLAADLTVLDHPLDLLDLSTLCGACQRLIIVDACATGAAPGTITRLAWPDRRIMEQHKHLTHSLALSDALQLADQLERLPPLVVLFGIEIASCQRESGLSPEVQRVLPEVERMIVDQVQLGISPAAAVDGPRGRAPMRAGLGGRTPRRNHERRPVASPIGSIQLPPRFE